MKPNSDNTSVDYMHSFRSHNLSMVTSTLLTFVIFLLLAHLFVWFVIPLFLTLRCIVPPTTIISEFNRFVYLLYQSDCRDGLRRLVRSSYWISTMTCFLMELCSVTFASFFFCWLLLTMFTLFVCRLHDLLLHFLSFRFILLVLLFVLFHSFIRFFIYSFLFVILSIFSFIHLLFVHLCKSHTLLFFKWIS